MLGSIFLNQIISALRTLFKKKSRAIKAPAKQSFLSIANTPSVPLETRKATEGRRH
jgi:hypothetical protein